MVYETGNGTIADAVDTVLSGDQIDRTTTIALLAQPVDELAAAADAVRATRAERDGAHRFGIVVAEKGVSKDKRPDEWANVLQAVQLVRDETDVEVDAVSSEAIRDQYGTDDE